MPCHELRVLQHNYSLNVHAVAQKVLWKLNLRKGLVNENHCVIMSNVNVFMVLYKRAFVHLAVFTDRWRSECYTWEYAFKSVTIAQRCPCDTKYLGWMEGW